MLPKPVVPVEGRQGIANVLVEYIEDPVIDIIKLEPPVMFGAVILLVINDVTVMFVMLAVKAPRLVKEPELHVKLSSTVMSDTS